MMLSTGRFANLVSHAQELGLLETEPREANRHLVPAPAGRATACDELAPSYSASGNAFSRGILTNLGQAVH